MRQKRAMRELVVHVGLNKTGSTSIQLTLCALHESLRARGIHVARTASKNYSRGHGNLAREVAADKWFSPDDGTLAELSEELRDRRERIVVISSEDFSRMGRAPEKHARLAALAAEVGRKLVIAAYVRDYPSALNSTYTQQIKSFDHDQEFRSWIRGVREGKRWGYRMMLAPFEAVADRMVVRAMPDDVVADFLRLLGYELTGFEPPRLNLSIGPRAVEACRLFRRHYQLAAGGEKKDDDRSTALALKPLLIRGIAERLGWNSEPFWGFDPAFAAETHEAFLARDAAFLDRNDVRFSPRFDRPCNDITFDDMTDTERDPFLRGLGEMVVGQGSIREAGKEKVKMLRPGARASTGA